MRQLFALGALVSAVIATTNPVFWGLTIMFVLASLDYIINNK